MTIAVDFDGTIVEDRYPGIGKPVPYAFETLISLQKAGHTLLLWTVREDRLLDEAVEFCRSNGVEFYAVNSESPAGGGPRKIRADVYIDDRCVGELPDWATIAELLDRGSAGAGHSFAGAGHSRGKSHRRRDNIFKRIAYRCRKSRERFG